MGALQGEKRPRKGEMCLYPPYIQVQNHFLLVHFMGVCLHPINLQRLKAEKWLEASIMSSHESKVALMSAFCKFIESHDVSKVDLCKSEGSKCMAGEPDGWLDVFFQELLHVHPKERPGLLQHLDIVIRAEDASDHR